ncbi:MAG: ferrochelatase [Gammaproteobacteria bacterium]|jgi:protoporphyrin/coproporphyrin ferrochelatase
MANYIGNIDFKHDAETCTGVLVTNLGTPDAPTPSALRRYLGEFLADSRVVEVPKFIWWFVLHGVILRTRPKRSAAAYRKVWTDEGSPLLSIAKKQAAAIQTYLDEHATEKIHVELAMRYGNPSIRSGLEQLRQANARKLIILPLYPQYSASTTASTFDAVSDVLKTWRDIPELHLVTHYHDAPDYIDALSESITEHWQNTSRAEKLLFSFHGIPKAYFEAGDPYYCECHKTARLVAEKLNLNEEEWMLTFQSRFGPKEWLKPYTDITLKELAQAGTKSVDVVCPGFSADCLETLEEIDMQNRKFFIEAGGENFSYIPALNDRPAHISTLANIIQKYI